MLSGGLCAPSTQGIPSCFSRRPSLPQIHKAILDLWQVTDGETCFPKWIDWNHNCRLLLRTTSRPITWKLSQSTSPRQVPWITMENNEQNSQVYPLLWIHPWAPSWYPSIYMTCPYGCHDRHLRFNMQTTWICPKLYSKLFHITVSPKTTCQDQKAGIILNSSLPIILYTEMSRSWWWILSDILKFTQLFHFYCLILVPATLHLLLYEQMAGANSVGKVIQKENHSCCFPVRDFPRGFPRMKPTFLSGFFTVAPASVFPLRSLSFSHTASFQSFKHAKVLLPQGFYFPRSPSHVTMLEHLCA